MTPNQADKGPNTSENDKLSDDEKWGYDLYPGRRGQNSKTNSWWHKWSGIENAQHKDKVSCEINVYNCIKNSPLVKLLVAALNSSGCKFDIRRHISCECCDDIVTGGYDPVLNQVVICQNTASSKRLVQGALSHELVHMFDYCRHNLDFKNLDHLACTEIRAANIGHCSFLGAWVNGLTSPLNVKGTHQVCVKDRAVKSIIAARRVSKEVAEEAVERVFDKCYNDLEPVGRRIRRNSPDMERAYAEASLYGYDK